MATTNDWHAGISDDWYAGIAEQIGSLKEKMSEEDYGFYQLDHFLRMVEKVADLSTHCDECKGFQGDTTKVFADLSDWPNTTAKQRDDYIMTFGRTFNHLEKHGTKFAVSRRSGCLFAVASWFGSAILLFIGVRQAVPHLFGPEDWSYFWFWGVPSIALFITGIVFLVLGFRKSSSIM